MEDINKQMYMLVVTRIKIVLIAVHLVSSTSAHGRNSDLALSFMEYRHRGFFSSQPRGI